MDINKHQITTNVGKLGLYLKLPGLIVCAQSFLLLQRKKEKKRRVAILFYPTARALYGIARPQILSSSYSYSYIFKHRLID